MQIESIAQVMEDLLEEWCVSGGHPYDLDVTSLSVALEQARLKYHAQVRPTNQKSTSSLLIFVARQFKMNLKPLRCNLLINPTTIPFPF